MSSSSSSTIKIEEQDTETVINYFYCFLSNIPSTFHSADLRNYFGSFVHSQKFDCFHFRHRPQQIKILDEKDNNPDLANEPNQSKIKDSQCCLIRFNIESNASEFIRKYHGKYWMDRDGNELVGRCIVQRIKLSSDELTKFSKELHPPGQLMPNGNVGTSNEHFLDLIKKCKLPPSLIKKLGLEFPKGRRYKKYTNVPFDYGTETEEAKYSENIESDLEDVVTARGHKLSDVYVPKPKEDEPKSPEPSFNREESDSEEDDDRCEEWERHEALNEDVTSQERLKERLYEDEIELVWEKGGPGIVWYTDAQYWDSLRGGFDERTSDDLDVDMQGYYDPGAGDKDARDSLEIRQSQRFQAGLETISVFKKPMPPKERTIPKKQSSPQEAAAVFKKPAPMFSPSSSLKTHKRKFSPASSSTSNSSIGTFEEFTKGIGRKLMEDQGWKDGLGLGKQNKGIKEALHNEGKIGFADKSGLGYYGEKIEFKPSRKSKNTFESFDNGESTTNIRIGTIFDKKEDLDTQEPDLRSNDLKFIKRSN